MCEGWGEGLELQGLWDPHVAHGLHFTFPCYSEWVKRLEKRDQWRNVLGGEKKLIGLFYSEISSVQSGHHG